MSHYIKLSLQQNLALGQIVKLQDNTFFYFSFSPIERWSTWSCKRKTSLKITWEFKDTRIWFKQRSMLRLKHDLLWTKNHFLGNLISTLSIKLFCVCQSFMNTIEMKNRIKCQTLTIYLEMTTRKDSVLLFMII